MLELTEHRCSTTAKTHTPPNGGYVKARLILAVDDFGFSFVAGDAEAGAARPSEEIVQYEPACPAAPTTLNFGEAMFRRRWYAKR